MILIPGPASSELGSSIALSLGVEPRPVEHRIFPDGESYIRLTTPVEGETVVIVQTTAPKQDQRLMQLFMMAGTAKGLGAERVVCVVPYLAYSRQDKRFLEGEALSLDMVLELLESLGADDLIVVDAHNTKSLDKIETEHEISVHNLSAIPLLAKELKKIGFEGAYSLSPDKGAIHLADAAAEILGGGSGFFEKFRDRMTGEIEMKVKDLNIAGEKAVVFDDIISSGGTMARAVDGLKVLGADMIAAACTHALLMNGAKEKIEKAGADLIISSDTIHDCEDLVTVSIAPMIAGALKSLK